MAKCEHEENDQLFFYISFHVHPDDAKLTRDKIIKAIESASATGSWDFTETKPGRFFLNPNGLSDIDNLKFNTSDISIAQKAYIEIAKINMILNN